GYSLPSTIHGDTPSITGPRGIAVPPAQTMRLPARVTRAIRLCRGWTVATPSSTFGTLSVSTTYGNCQCSATAVEYSRQSWVDGSSTVRWRTTPAPIGSRSATDPAADAISTKTTRLMTGQTAPSPIMVALPTICGRTAGASTTRVHHCRTHLGATTTLAARFRSHYRVILATLVATPSPVRATCPGTPHSLRISRSQKRLGSNSAPRALTS